MAPFKLRIILAVLYAIVPTRADIEDAISYEDFLYGPYHLNCITDTEWVKGSGRPIRNMLENIISRFNDKDAVFAAFERDIHPIMAMAPEGAEDIDHYVSWISYGQNKHDGWLYGEFANTSERTGDDIYYIYSDYITAIRGKFVKGKMLYGRQVRLTHFRCMDELLEVEFTEPDDDDPVFHYEQPTETRLTLRPTLMDPIDRRNVYVAASTLGEETGEGLFAKRQLVQGELICLYAGALLPKGRSMEWGRNMSQEAANARFKNLMTLGEDGVEVDVAEDNIVKFRASLGHKAQHSFVPNAQYCTMKSPRFGTHKCVEAKQDIKQGEEIFVDYGFKDLHSVNLPDWYRQLFIETYPERAHEVVEYSC